MNKDRHSDFNYHSPRWRRVRDAYIKDNPLCEQCKREGKINLYQKGNYFAVDHIKPIRLGGDPYNPDNLQTLCEPHHAQKSAKERGIIYTNFTILFGPPASGKTTYAIKERKDDELIVDMDLIYKAFTGTDKKNSKLLPAMIKIFYSSVKAIAKSNAVPKAYILTTKHKIAKELKEQLGCDVMFFNVDKDECLKRAYADSTRDKYVSKAIINSWFNSEYKLYNIDRI